MPAISARSKPKKRCYWCEVPVHFDKGHVTKDGKSLPLLDSGQVHDCRAKRRIMKVNRMGRASARINKCTNRGYW